jgi:hypothetical protein
VFHQDDFVTALADAVLPLIRTRAEVWRWNVADAHGTRMHEAVTALREAAETEDPTVVFAVTQKAIASALRVIMRADDSSGIIGDACRDLLELHPRMAEIARPATAQLIDWMIKFQFENECDYLTIDPVAYAPALGELGIARYRAKLDAVAASLGTRPPDDQRWTAPRASDWHTLDWNAQRLAVLDRDVDAIIRTHARDRRVAVWHQDTAEALEEIGQTDLAIDWAKQATDFDSGHQARRAANYWCELLARYRPDNLLAARVEVFRRWPSSTTAADLYQAAGAAWPDYREDVFARLAPMPPRDTVVFALAHLKDIPLAWNLAHTLGLADDRTWSDLAKAYEKFDPLAVLPVHTELVENELAEAGAQHYRNAARRLKKMRKLAAGSDQATEVNELIADLRHRYHRRPRLQLEFDRAGLP